MENAMKWGVLLAALSLAGCMASKSGSERIMDDQTVSKIEPGKSTKADVKALFGEPSKVTFAGTGEGEEDWDYYYTKAEVRGATWVPIYGAFKGGVDGNTSILTIRFSRDGFVKQVGRGKSAMSGGNLLGK